MYSVYALYNKVRDKIYIGYTSDTETRLKRHNGILKNRQSSYTKKNSGLWELVYEEKLPTRTDATRREKQLKSYQGRKYIRNKVIMDR